MLEAIEKTFVPNEHVAVDVNLNSYS